MVDTSILIRRINRKDPEHRLARNAIQALRQNGEDLCIVPQNLYELWSVCTRLGLIPEQAALVLSRIEGSFNLLFDREDLYNEWKRIVVEYGVSGRPSHDARLVAAMNLHGIHALLTFNVQDFTRYKGPARHMRSHLKKGKFTYDNYCANVNVLMCSVESGKHCCQLLLTRDNAGGNRQAISTNSLKNGYLSLGT